MNNRVIIWKNLAQTRRNFPGRIRKDRTSAAINFFFLIYLIYSYIISLFNSYIYIYIYIYICIFRKQYEGLRDWEQGDKHIFSPILSWRIIPPTLNSTFRPAMTAADGQVLTQLWKRVKIKTSAVNGRFVPSKRTVPERKCALAVISSLSRHRETGISRNDGFHSEGNSNLTWVHILV